jgi:hypothetical protein
MTIQWTFLPSLFQICFVGSLDGHNTVIYKIFVFGADRKSNMAARAHNVFWLVEILKIFLLETTSRVMAAILNFRSANDSQV